MKNFLVNIPTERNALSLISAALSVTRIFGGRLDAVTVAYERVPVGYSPVGGMAGAELYEAEQEEALSRAQAASALFETEALNAGLAFTSKTLTAIPFEAAASVGALARLYDLTILLQPDPELSTYDNALPQEILFEAGGPVLFIPYVYKGDLKAQHIGIAWDGSRPAARAVRDALPFLSAARKISIISVNEIEQQEVSAEALMVQLARRRIHAKALKAFASRAEIQPAILSVAADEELDVLVMGAYGHSRLQERLLGGVSRDMLRSMTVPTLMSH